MTHVATSRLMEATADLPPADRALVNLWVNRGLDDAALAQLLGISEETIAGRRARIVEQLSATLGLPPDHVHSALAEISVAPADGEGEAGGAVVPGEAGAVPDAAAQETTASEPPAEAEAPADSQPQPQRRWRLWGLAAAAIAAICLLVVVLSSGGSGHHPRATTASTPTQPATPTTPGGSATTAASGKALSALPGATGHATGSVSVTHGLTLNLTVSDLPPASHGHYEIWLYNSLTNSVPLGRLRTGVDHLSLTLPHDAARYQWIDISLQPPGAVFHSGESQLRAANPLFHAAASSSS